MKLSKTKNSPSNWIDLLGFNSLDDKDTHEAQMLMFSFLSEIEKYQELNKVNRKSLAEKIKTSPSYLTQVFRGDKPLNFYTLSKIQRVLNIKFNIKATQNGEQLTHSSSLIPQFFSNVAINTGYNSELPNKEREGVLLKGGKYDKDVSKKPSYIPGVEEISYSMVMKNS